MSHVIVQIPYLAHAPFAMRIDKCPSCGVAFSTLFGTVGGDPVYAHPDFCPFCTTSLFGVKMSLSDGVWSVSTETCSDCDFLFPFFTDSAGERRFTMLPNYCPACGAPWQKDDLIGKRVIAAWVNGWTVGHVISQTGGQVRVERFDGGAEATCSVENCHVIQDDCPMCVGQGFALPEPIGDLNHDTMATPCPSCVKGA